MQQCRGRLRGLMVFGLTSLGALTVMVGAAGAGAAAMHHWAREHGEHGLQIEVREADSAVTAAPAAAATAPHVLPEAAPAAETTDETATLDTLASQLAKIEERLSRMERRLDPKGF